MEILLYLLGTAGLTWIMVDSEIMLPFRNWLAQPSYKTWMLRAWAYTFGRIIPWKVYTWINTWIIQFINNMIHCYGCCGFWCGLFCGWLIFTIPWWQVLACGFAGSFIAPLGYLLLNYLEAGAIISLPAAKEKHEPKI